MTTGLVIGAVVFLALLALGVWLMERARAEPSARANEEAPDPAEEREVRERSEVERGVLADPPGD
jgi:cytochrome c-type biogenesis protein CcmH/NrfG